MFKKNSEWRALEEDVLKARRQRNFFLHFDSAHYHKPPQPRSAHFARCARDRSLILRRDVDVM